ncbi:MAG: UDP-glucose--hexose-1-phosphate uridylyltransferase [Thermotaleaceae bacterium]
MNVHREIKRLIHYGIEKKLIYPADEVYVINRILEALKEDTYEAVEIEREFLGDPQPILDNLLDYAYEKELLENNSITYRDLFDTRIMDCLMPRPSELIRRFYEDYRQSPEKATENYYQLSKASNYIRTQRIDKNIGWKTATSFGELEITINLSKPEKDPKAIAAAKKVSSTDYPKCLLCKENEGYSGRVNHPARQNHRVIPIELCQEEWFLQFSPYVYYHEHSIIFKGSHEPMRITKTTFDRLLDFVKKFPHYFIGSNADLPIVGGSILSHDHFQGGRYTFPMELAPTLKKMKVEGFEDISIGILKWPLSVIRIEGQDRHRLAVLGEVILEKWKDYDAPQIDIQSRTAGEPHNTITPIARYKEEKYQLDLVLRNNRTSKEHPLGIFHPHQDVHHIKKENIGLIEVMGLAVLPARLMEELELIKICLQEKKKITQYRELSKHREWFEYLQKKYTSENIDFDPVLREEVGKVFERILWDAGVFKQDAEGLAAFEDFINCL